eukprot:15035624-Alexandrium_andersonii.AAC.1
MPRPLKSTPGPSPKSRLSGSVAPWELLAAPGTTRSVELLAAPGLLGRADRPPLGLRGGGDATE